MLRFRLLGIPVGVHVTFLLIVIFGPRDSAISASLWVGAAFIAIMLHEFGHALFARRFGAQGVSVTLYGLGGLTSYTDEKGMGHGRSFIVSAAGSAVGIVAGLTLIGLGRLGLFDTWPLEAVDFLDYFVWVALIWGVLNWVPIVPLDGGHMVEHLIAIFSEDRAPHIAQIITWIAVAVIVPIALFNGLYFAAIIVVVFAAAGFRDYRSRTAKQPPPSEEPQPTPSAPPTPPTPPTPDEPPPSFPI
jgi:Zn-dependent protease